MQSGNASSQYTNKHAFAFYQKLADDFDLRIIRMYGAAGHEVTQDIFFNDSKSIVNYLAQKKPEFS